MCAPGLEPATYGLKAPLGSVQQSSVVEDYQCFWGYWPRLILPDESRTTVNGTFLAPKFDLNKLSAIA